MHYLIFLLTCSAVASATTYFISVFAPDTEVDGVLLNAAAQGFYAGTSGPVTYCPPSIKNCPEVKGTLVYERMTGMAVNVPGGQRIYVEPSGKVKYTQAHSNYIPQGSFVGGWFNKTVLSDCDPAHDVVDFLSTDGSNVGGVKLCPDVESYMANTGASYRLYATTPGFNLTDCVDTVGLTLHGTTNEVGCWQYI
ncbi:hypothetical protein GGR54DRAFT_285227 [Hypoxylon sp. NC1633]|nr:hypothetical protein GGR54DRAFT_285227 [Hypoxylon sp. NC1633]